ncbi:MAG: N-glycosylase/DNA lyase [Candidatus Methanospirare jalkutatii]|nr:N-glycosylase/DNA lyase [Candidatus Methanospirare jalkutatii]
MGSKEYAKEILRIYQHIKHEIEARLSEFKRLWAEGSEEDIFAELAFCILTPQTKARNCWDAVLRLRDADLLLKGNEEQVAEALEGVRFRHKKAKYIVEARNFFSKNGQLSIKSALKSVIEAENAACEAESGRNFARDWLSRHILGFGYKEASHFLRNIGFGENIAILDRHILRNLMLLGVIDEIPHSLSKKRYLDIERRMRIFASEIGVRMSHLDLVLWYKEVGEVFK